jgi:type I restriction-modification system DNA methylase subunit
MEDGYLAACEIQMAQVNLDETGLTAAEIVARNPRNAITGQPLTAAEIAAAYERTDYEATLLLPDRVNAMCLEEQEADAIWASYASSLKRPYRWKDWAAPLDSPAAKPNKRKELEDESSGAFMKFVNAELIPYLKKLKDRASATPRQKVISEIMSGVERVRIDTEKNLLDVLDKVDEISNESIDPTHVFALSQVYEGLLLKMGEKGSDAGQFFTPREVIRAMVRAIDPKIGETVYDPCCGTGGFLAQAAEHMKPKPGARVSGAAISKLKTETFWGREKENLIYPIGLANLVLHGIDHPNIWHGNALTKHEVYGGLFAGAPSQFDVVLTNPPFGGKENHRDFIRTHTRHQAPISRRPTMTLSFEMASLAIRSARVSTPISAAVATPKRRIS